MPFGAHGYAASLPMVRYGGVPRLGNGGKMVVFRPGFKSRGYQGRGGQATGKVLSGSAPAEKNVRDTIFENKAFTLGWAGGEMDFLLMPVQGTDFAKRTGNFINVTSVQVNFRVDKPAIEGNATPQADIQWTVALVWDKQTNGIILNAEDVYDVTTNTFETESMRNIKFTKRFQVLKRWTGTLKVGNTSVSESAGVFASSTVVSGMQTVFYRFPKGLRCQLDGNTGGVADVQDHSFHLIGCASSVLANLTGTARIRFTSA